MLISCTYLVLRHSKRENITECRNNPEYAHRLPTKYQYLPQPSFRRIGWRMYRSWIMDQVGTKVWCGWFLTLFSPVHGEDAKRSQTAPVFKGFRLDKDVTECVK